MIGRNKYINSALLLALIVFFAPSIQAQSGDEYGNAMYEYSCRQYSAAYQHFIAYLNNRRPDEPACASARYYAAMSLYRMNDLEGAALEFEKVLGQYRLSEFSEEALYQSGIIYFHLGQYESSRIKLQRLMDDFPESGYAAAALYSIGESYKTEKKDSSAIEIFELALNSKANNAYLDRVIFSIAGIYEERGDYSKAIEYYDRLLSYHANSPLYSSAQIRIGFCYFHLKDFETSIIELSNPVVDALPAEKRAEAFYLLGNSFFQTGEYQRAQTTFERIIQQYPEISIEREIKYSIAWCQFQQRKYAEAYNSFHSLINTGDTIARSAMYYQGEALRYQGKDNEALRAFQDYISKFPGTPHAQWALYQQGAIHFHNQAYDKALLHLRVSAGSSDKELAARSYLLLAEMALARKAYDTAQSNFSAVIAMPGLSSTLLNQARLGAGVAYYSKGDFQNAARLLEACKNSDSLFERSRICFYFAECKFAAGDYQSALKYYQQVKDASAEMRSYVDYAIAYCYYNLKDFDNAGYSFADYIRKYPNEPKILDVKLRLADAYYTAKKYTEAIAAYDDLLKMNAVIYNRDYLSYQYALALYKCGRTQQAVVALNKILASFPSSKYAENALYLMGWMQFQQSEYQKAINAYMYLVSFAPQSILIPLAWYSAGDAYYNLGSYDSAKSCYQKVISDYPHSIQAMDAVNGVHLCYLALGDYAMAAAALNTYIKQNPQAVNTDVLYIKEGEIYAGQGNNREALNCYRQLIKRFPGSALAPKAIFNMGEGYSLEGIKDSAIACYKKVFEEFPASEEAVSAVSAWGRILLSRGSYDAASKVFDNGIEKFTSITARAELMYYKGITLNLKGDTTSAYDVFDEVVMYYDTVAYGDKSRLELGIMQMKFKRYSDAQKYFRDLITKRDDDLGAAGQYYLGVISLDQRKYSDAITAFVRVHNVFAAYDEWVTKAFLRMGEAYEALKNPAKAKEMYNAILTKHTDDAFANEAREKLGRLP